MERLLRHFVLRVLLVFFVTTLCMFLALSEPVLRSGYLAVAHFLDFLANLGDQARPLLTPAWNAYWRSMILVGGAVIAGVVLGVPLGLLSGLGARSPVGRAAGMLSYVGTLTPSFVFGLAIMLFFVSYLGRWTGMQWIRIAPSPGVPEPREIIAPTLTLAARPVAHIAQLTAHHVREQLHASYVMTARSKGLGKTRVLFGHIWPNVAVPVLNATTASMLFSLSSLPIVEFIFGWNGVGFTLFQAVLNQQTILAAFLLVALGLTLTIITAAVEALTSRLDPRLASLRGEH